MGWVAAGGLSLVIGGIVYKVLERVSPKGVGAYSDSQEARDSTRSTSNDTTSSPPPREEENFSTEIGRTEIVMQITEAEEACNIDGKENMETLSEDGVERFQTQGPSVASIMPPPPRRPRSPPRLSPPTFGPRPTATRPSNGAALRTLPSSAASSLRIPQTKVLPNASMAPSSSLSTPPRPDQPSRRVILRPGHSPLDWAKLTSSPGHKLRGQDVPEGGSLIRVSPSQLKYHNGRRGREAWTVYQGRVYNITPYLPFHPGGEGELMRGAGRDAEKFFMEVHPWVNWDALLGECLVGILVSEADHSLASSGGGNSGGLDDMD